LPLQTAFRSDLCACRQKLRKSLGGGIEQIDEAARLGAAMRQSIVDLGGVVAEEHLLDALALGSGRRRIVTRFVLALKGRQVPGEHSGILLKRLRCAIPRRDQSSYV
jgi:hypothetical protein